MRLAGLVVLGLCLAGNALADADKPPPPPAKAPAAPPAPPPPPPEPAFKNDPSCKQDLETFCGDVQPGEGRIFKCLADHETELSNTCKKRVADLRATGGECQDDIAKFCASVPHARGKLAACLTAHRDELSEPCKNLAVAPPKPPAPPAPEPDAG